MNSFSTPDSPRGLAAGTLVTTPDGDKKIEEIKTGDLVLSGVGDGHTQFSRVEKAAAKIYCGPVRYIDMNSGQRLCATPNHICFGFYSYTPFDEGKIDLIAFDSFDKEKELPIHCLVGNNGGEFDYDLDSLEKEARLLSQCHSASEVARWARFCEEKLFRFTPASKLMELFEMPIACLLGGDLEVTTTQITNITEEQYDGLIYTLDIPEARNFAANGVLVHDSRS